jgi:tetratricopeptide (TPR) repeat protein
MQTPDSDSLESAVSLFDVLISMPPDADLETIQILAENEAGLSAQRVERLISVLRNTPNAKVGAGLPLARAEEERQRFIKAGLNVEVTPAQPAEKVLASEAIKNSFGSTEFFSDSQARFEPEQKSGTSQKSFFKGGAGLLIGLALVIAAGLFYMGQTGISIGGVSVPWGKKASLPAVATAPTLTDDADADDPLIEAARGGSTAAEKSADATGLISKLAKPAKQQLTADFAVMLAEIGHSQRASEVLKALASSINPGTDPRASAVLQAAQLKLQAWSAQRMDSAQARQAAENLKAKTSGIPNALDRAQLQGQIAVILSRNPQLPADVPRMYLSLGTESLKAITGSRNNAALGDLLVSTAAVSLNETTARAKAGAWSKAKASAAQIEDLLKRAPDDWAQAHLYALDYQAKLQTGQLDKAEKSLESALALANKNTNLPERAVWLRGISQLSDASTQEQFESVATALQNQLSAKSGMEKARGLTDLSLLYSAAGLPGKAGQLRSLAQATTGLSAADSLAIETDLLVRGDMATAKLLHGLGRYAEAEVVLLRMSGYLF